MKTISSIVLLFACAFSLNAQITSTLNHLAGGLDEVWIQNDSAIDLVAFVVTVMQEPRSAASSSSPFVVYSDPLVDPPAKPLVPGEKAQGDVDGRGSGYRSPRQTSFERAHSDRWNFLR